MIAGVLHLKVRAGVHQRTITHMVSSLHHTILAYFSHLLFVNGTTGRSIVILNRRKLALAVPVLLPLQRFSVLIQLFFAHEERWDARSFEIVTILPEALDHPVHLLVELAFHFSHHLLA